MLRIAICDDDEAAVCAHRKAVEDCLGQCGSEGEVVAYTRSDNLRWRRGRPIPSAQTVGWRRFHGRISCTWSGRGRTPLL